MALPCKFIYNGKEYSEKEFKELILKGEFDKDLSKELLLPKDSGDIATEQKTDNNGKDGSQKDNSKESTDETNGESGSKEGDGKEKVKKEGVAEPPTGETTPLNEIDEDSPLEVSLQRDRLMEEVKSVFYKPSDGIKSISDNKVFENAVNTVADEAKISGRSVNEQLENNVKEWYNTVFDENGNRIKDKNGREKQILLSDEQQAMVAMHMMNIEKQIRETKYNPLSELDAISLDSLEGKRLQAQNLAGVTGESTGRSLRYLGTFYKLDNNAEFELERKKTAQIFGKDIPLDENEFNEFVKGLTQKQQRVAEVMRRSLLNFKDKLDKENEYLDKYAAMTDEQFNQEVQKQVRSVIDKDITEAKKDWETESKKAAKENKTTDSKGRVIKEKANDLATKLHDIADKLGGKSLTMSSPLGLVQITAKWVLKGIAEGIRQGGKIPELIERYMNEAKLRDEFKGADEAKLFEQVQSSLTELGIDKKVLEAKPQSEISIDAIKEFAKNSNINLITKEAISKGLVKELFHSLGEQGIPVDKVAEKAVELLTKQGIVTDVTDINQAYLGRGKYKLETKRQLDEGVAKNKREISEYEKLQFDINEIDKKIKEVEQSGELSLPKRDEKIQNLNKEKEAKYAEFEKVLTSKGIKLEKGSKFSRQQKEAVIESNNADAKALGESISNKLNDGYFGDISEGTKNFLRDLQKKLSHKINAHNLDGQIDVLLGKLKTALNDFEDNHFTVDKRENKALEGVSKSIYKMVSELQKNRDKAAEEIKLTDYKKRLESEKKEYERRKAAGDWDDTKLSIDLKKDATVYQLQREKDVAKFSFFRAKKDAEAALESTAVKAAKGGYDMLRNLLLSGLTGIQAKLGLSAATRQAQFLSRPIARFVGRLTGIESVRLKTFGTKNYASTEWRALRETVLGKTEKQAQQIIAKSAERLEKSVEVKNNAEQQYKDLVIQYGENSKEATQYRLNELKSATTEYEAAALENAVNDIYNHITPLNKGGRWIILKEGITREEQEAGLLGKRETLKDYLHLGDEKVAEEYRKRYKSLPEKTKTVLKSAIFYSKMIVRSHGLWKDMPARHELVKGYINRLRDAQLKGENITDYNVKSKLWIDAVLNDMQEAKFQDKNKAVDAVRKVQSFMSGEGANGKDWIKDEITKKILKVVADAATPVLKVPMNIYKASMHYTFGSLIGTLKVVDAFYKAKGLDIPLKEYADTKMTDEQKYNIQTLIGRGAVGAAIMAWSYYGTMNGNIIMGGSFPDKKKKAKLADGSEVELDYGDIVVNGHQVPHYVAKAIVHLPQGYAMMIANDLATDNIYQQGKQNPHAFVESLINTSKILVADLPALPIGRTKNKYEETELSLENPYSYLGYIGAVKDLEKAAGVEKKAPEYLLTVPETYYNRAGLMWLVPTKQEAEDRLKKEKDLLKESSRQIRQEHPDLFKK